MNVTIISPLDIAHQSSLIFHGINEYTKHKCRYILLKESYLGYPTDILYDKVEPYEIIEVLANTDFFIFTTQLTRFGFYELAGKLSRNNHLIMTYGSEVRMRPADFLLSWLRSDMMIVTSHDYTQSSPVGFSAQHIPIMLDFNEIPERQPPGDDVIRVFHSPTAPKLKNTDLFLKSMKNLEKKFARKKTDKIKVETVLVEGKPWKTCLEQKSHCDIVYDQFAIGSYGMGTVESWAIGLPVVGRANSWVRSWYPDVPILDANAATLQTRLEGLILNENVREEAGRQGRLFVEEHHDLEKNIKKLMFLIRHVQER